MRSEDHDPLHAVIHAKLAAIAATAPTPPTWQAPWQRLGPEATDAERLAVYQAVRDAGSVPADAGFYLVAWQIDNLTLPDADTALRELENRFDAIRQAHGLGEDECWAPGEAPPEYEAAREAFYEAWNALYAAKLDELGEFEMAHLFRTDREQFDQRNEAGRRFFHGDPADGDGEPPWLEDLMEAVTGCLETTGPMGRLGCRFGEEENFWEIQVFPTPVELVGGAQDGAVVAPGFSLDLEQLRAAFDSVAAVGWNAFGVDDVEGPYVYVEGVFLGHEVYVQILAEAPEDEEPGMKVDVRQ